MMGMRPHGGRLLSNTVRDNKAESRFELEADGETSYAYYRLSDGVVTFLHTEVPPSISGRGIGSRLVQGALDEVRKVGLKVASRCSFVSSYLARHPEFSDLVH